MRILGTIRGIAGLLTPILRWKSLINMLPRKKYMAVTRYRSIVYGHILLAHYENDEPVVEARRYLNNTLRSSLAAKQEGLNFLPETEIKNTWHQWNGVDIAADQQTILDRAEETEDGIVVTFDPLQGLRTVDREVQTYPAEVIYYWMVQSKQIPLRIRSPNIIIGSCDNLTNDSRIKDPTIFFRGFYTFG